MIHDVKMSWDREKVVWLIKDYKYSEQYLKSLDDYDLFELGKKEEFFKGDNPFIKKTQKRITEY